MIDPDVKAVLDEFTVRPVGDLFEVIDRGGAVRKTTSDIGIARRYAIALTWELIRERRKASRP